MTTQPAISVRKSELGISTADLYRLSVDQYHAIADAAILEEDDPVELLEGWLVCKYGPFDAPVSRIVAPSDGTPQEEEDGLTLAWIWRFTHQQYHALIEAGILKEADPVELLGGWLIRKMTQKPVHPIVVDMVRDAFVSQLARRFYVRVQAPITLPEGEPEPDVVLVRGAREEYVERHPGPAEILLAVEVADTSLARDRGVKKQIYAQAGILVYWIVNLIDRRVEVYTDPTGPSEFLDYRQRQNYGPADEIPLTLDGTEVNRIAVRELLPNP